MESNDTWIFFGDAVKALDDNGRIGALGIRFSTAAKKDLAGEFFTGKTYLGPSDGDGAECTFDHGFPIAPGLEEFADHTFAAVKAERRGDVGIWVETVLDLADEYEKSVFELAKKGKLGWSSAAAGHRVKKNIKTGEITSWPVAEFALTPRPCEPDNYGTALPLKSFAAVKFVDLTDDEIPESKTKSVTLATRLTRKIDDLADDGQERTDIVKRMAREAMAEVAEVEDVLSGKKRRPSNAALKAFSRVLGISYDTLKAVADHQRKGADSLKSAFDEAVAEEMSEGLCKYELDCILGRLAGDIALMAKASQTTGTSFSLDQAVSDLVAAYAPYLQASITGQVNDWLEPGESEMYDPNEFYLKSLIRIDPDVMRSVTKSITMDEHLLLVGTAEEDLVARFDANAKPRGKSTKAGRELSDKNRQRLQKMKDAHKEHADQMQSDMQGLLDATMPKASDAEKNAVLAKHLVLRRERRQQLGV